MIKACFKCLIEMKFVCISCTENAVSEANTIMARATEFETESDQQRSRAAVQAKHFDAVRYLLQHTMLCGKKPDSPQIFIARSCMHL